MPSKNKSVYFCKECGNESSIWQGQCRACGAWNSYVEAPSKNYSKHTTIKPSRSITPQKLSEIKIDEKSRIKTNISELDNVLNGGIVPGQVILLGGQPGIGKSTLLLQIADKIGRKVLYVSGEESDSQVALRSSRLKLSNKEISIVSTADLDGALSNAEEYDFVIIDSIQTVFTDKSDGSAGTITQIRECAFQLIEFAKSNNVPVVIVGHITKEGNIAGPKLLEHMVDTVLYLEGDKQHMFRILRVNKNRYGDDSEVGIFEMTALGLVEVYDTSKFFLQNANLGVSGNSVAMILEGNKPLAIDVQALVTKSHFGYPKRAANGFSINKLTLLCAVIEKRSGVDISEYDVYLNVASGLNIKEPGVDLAVCVAIMSSFFDVAIPIGSVFIGEVGLSGEIRKVFLQEKRIKEAKRLKIQNIYSSDSIINLRDLVKIFNVNKKTYKE